MQQTCSPWLCWCNRRQNHQQVGRLVSQGKQLFCDASISAAFDAAHWCAISSTEQKFARHFLNAIGGPTCNLPLTSHQHCNRSLLPLTLLCSSYNLLTSTLWLMCMGESGLHCYAHCMPVSWTSPTTQATIFRLGVWTAAARWND